MTRQRPSQSCAALCDGTRATSGSTTTWGGCWSSAAQRDEAIRFYTAARAARPDTAHELAHALSARGESDEATEVFRDLTRLRPRNGRHLYCLASELRARGLSREAKAILEQAVASSRAALRLKPTSAQAHMLLGIALRDQKKVDVAVAEHREAIR